MLETQMKAVLNGNCIFNALGEESRSSGEMKGTARRLKKIEKAELSSTSATVSSV